MTELMLVTPVLPIAHFSFVFRFEGNNQLPAYAGSAWRGAFGTALKQTVCVVRDTACQHCMLKESCAYPYIFETPPPAHSEKMRKYNAAPHPFVIQPKLEKQPDSNEVRLGFALFGRSYRYLPYIIHAFDKAGRHGLGSKRQVFELVDVMQLKAGEDSLSIYRNGKLVQPALPEAPTIPDCPEEITVHLETPLRIKQDGKNCNAQRLTFAAFFGSLLRRHSMLTYFHTDSPLETDFSGLMAVAKTIQMTQQQLSWHDWTRYSSRQQTRIDMGGLLGTFTLSGDLQHFWPYLWLGQWTHTGKGTCMGLGAYTITIGDKACRTTSLPFLKT
ncbi:MAG: CRISPR system precrRNA processing endoribonuclease RAMP protein Cas6 [Methylovulum sp.]